MTGYPIVLTADRALMGNYRTLLDGIFGNLATDIIPSWFFHKVISPAIKVNSEGRAVIAPYGLRKLEAVLLANGFGSDEVIVTTPGHLEEVVSANTRIICVSSSDPFGLGTTNTTIVDILNGTLYTKKLYAILIARIKKLRKNFHNFKVIAGGAGSWQFLYRKEYTGEMGIDYVFIGDCEKTAYKMIKKIINGSYLPKIIYGEKPAISDIPEIVNASNIGVVEISRGCGRGCMFCAQAHYPMMHFGIDKIKREIHVNINNNVCSATLLSEDFLRYGSNGIEVNKNAVRKLFVEISKIQALKAIQPDFVNISSLQQVSDAYLKELHNLMIADRKNIPIWLEAGVETGSARLLKIIAPMKVRKKDFQSWKDIVVQQTEKMIDANFFPILSFVIGLPGESSADIVESIDLADRLKNHKAVLFPIFYVSLSNSYKSFRINKMSYPHWQLLEICYETMYKHMPSLFSYSYKACRAPFFSRFFRTFLCRWSMNVLKRKVSAKSKSRFG